MSDVSEQSLLDYFYVAGGISGKVKNADISKQFKPFIGHSDLKMRAKYREEFKLIIDRIAVVKSENGEKYLLLKKKYRQHLGGRDTESHGTDWDGQSNCGPVRTSESPPPAPQKEAIPSAAPLSEERRGQVLWCGGPSIQPPSQEEEHATETTTQPTLKEYPVIQVEEASTHCNGEDELDKDSGSKSESEQDEDCTSSMGSNAVALDPIEKDWIYSAACAQVPELSQLLRQEPSLANKKDFTSTALHWAAKHGNEDMATLVANAGADVNTKSGGYTPLHIAALHGHRHILDLLIGTYGAKESIRDYSGHLPCYYINIREPEEYSAIQLQVTQARERNRNRKLGSLFHSKKKWGSAEELAPIEEEKATPHQLMLPAFRPRKFSR